MDLKERLQIIWEYGVLAFVLLGIMIMYHEMGHYLIWAFLHWDSMLLGIQPVIEFGVNYVGIRYPFWDYGLAPLLVTAGGFLGSVGFFYFWNRVNESKKVLIVLYNAYGLFEIWMRIIDIPLMVFV